MGMTLASFSFSGKTPVCMILFVISAKDLTSVGAICFNKFVDIPSEPQLSFFGRLFIVILIVSS